jgi:hypothetical protein
VPLALSQGRYSHGDRDRNGRASIERRGMRLDPPGAPDSEFTHALEHGLKPPLSLRMMIMAVDELEILEKPIKRDLVLVMPVQWPGPPEQTAGVRLPPAARAG